MALHSTLPIYKVTYELLVLATEITRNMPRDFKASMGGKIREECLELVLLIYRANVATDKVPHLDRLIERLQVAELLLRVAAEPKLRLVATKHYAKAIELTAAIGKQASGWRKYSAKSPVAWHHWIPVRERTPDRQYDVLVTDGEFVGIGDCCKGHLWNSPGIDGAVTHWMPLPPVPALPEYPQHCTTPEKCIAAGRCTRDPNCID